VKYEPLNADSAESTPKRAHSIPDLQQCSGKKIAPVTMQNEPQRDIRFSTTVGQLLILAAAILVLNLAWRYVL
jgi:hypothetical protein